MKPYQPTWKFITQFLTLRNRLLIVFLVFITNPGYLQNPIDTFEISSLKKFKYYRNASQLFVKKDFDLAKNYSSILSSFKPFKGLLIPPDKVTSKVITRFHVVNNADEVAECYFFPGFYFSNVNMYTADKDNLLTKIPSYAPAIRDNASVRRLTVAAHDSVTLVIECFQIKTYVNLLRPRFIEEDYLLAYILEIQSTRKGEALFTYVFCGLLIMMVLFSFANFIQGFRREFLYYAVYAAFMCVMLFTKQYYFLRSNFSSFFYEEFLDFILQGTGIIFFMAFMMRFLDTRKKHPFLNKLYIFGIVFLLISLSLYTFLHYGTDNYFLEAIIENYITKVILLLMVAIFLIYASRNWGDKMIRYLFFGHLLFFIFSMASLAMVLNLGMPKLPGILGSSLVLYEFGLLLELIFFLVALTYKNKITLIEKVMESERLKLMTERSELEKQKAVIAGQQEERERISADMHDELGSGMTTIRLMSEIAKNKMKETVPVEIEKISASANDLLNKMNAIIWSMNSSNDTVDNLVSYFRAYATDFFDNTPIDCTIYIPVVINHLEISGDKRRNIFLTLKEILNNALKHSKATKIKIDIAVDEKLSIKISDNGVGFDPEKTKGFGNGLKNTKRRMKNIGGELSINNVNGTEIFLELPL